MELHSPAPSRDDRTSRAIAILPPLGLLTTFVAAVSGLYAELSDHPLGSISDQWYPYCTPNGQVAFPSYDDLAGKYWDPSLILSVTLGFGGLSFAQAKAVDIAFDLIVGRGAQLLIAFTVYPILRRSFLRSLETTGVPIAVLFPLYLERISMESLWALVQNVTNPRSNPKTYYLGTKSKRRFDWRVIPVFLIMLYILAAPSFLSAMTSYQAKSIPYVKRWDSEDYMRADQLIIPQFVIADGDRIGLGRNFPVTNDSDIFETTHGCKSRICGSIVYACWTN